MGPGRGAAAAASADAELLQQLLLEGLLAGGTSQCLAVWAQLIVSGQNEGGPTPPEAPTGACGRNLALPVQLVAVLDGLPDLDVSGLKVTVGEAYGVDALGAIWLHAGDSQQAWARCAGWFVVAKVRGTAVSGDWKSLSLY
jgi:hypothetical protein